MSKSTIEWTDETWNPVGGCKAVSPGCANYYAARMAKRLAAMGQERYKGLVDEHGRWTGEFRVFDDVLTAPLRWRKPRRVSVNSEGDLFGEGVPFEFIAQVFAVMALCPQHTFQILSKRSERMAECVCKIYTDDEWFEINEAGNRMSLPVDNDIVANTVRPLPNVHLGVSVESQDYMHRVTDLLQCPAAVRFVSAEPLLGALDFNGMFPVKLSPNHYWQDCVCNEIDPRDRPCIVCEARSGLDWVIAGGESGPGARPMHPDWARSIRDQCKAAGVPFFFKQWGEWASVCDYYTEDDDVRDCALDNPHSLVTTGGYTWRVCDRDGRILDGQPPPGTWIMQRVGKKAAGARLDGVEHREFPR